MKSLEESISSHNNNFNLIRLVLASSVIFYHSSVLAGNRDGYSDPVGYFLATHGSTLGATAVCSFFFLSGIFVTQSFHRDGSPVNFFIRRFCRVWPGLFFCVFSTAIISCILCQGTNAIYYIYNPDFYHYIVGNSVFSLVWSINGIFEERSIPAINGSIHTLPTEVKMYLLLFGLGCLVSLKKQINIVAGAAFFLFVIFFFDKQMPSLIDTPYNKELALFFFMGVMTYAFAKYIKPYLWLGALSLVLTLVTSGLWTTTFLFITLFWIMIFVGQAKYCWSPKSDLSYGIYIYGWPSQQFVTTFLPNLHPYTHAALSLLMATGFAEISWRFIEKPAMAFGRELVATWNHFRKSSIRPDWAVGLSATWPRCAAMPLLFLACALVQWSLPYLTTSVPPPPNLKILALSPTSTKKGQGFHIENGSSVISLTLDAPPPKEAKIVFERQPLDTIVNQNTVTAIVPKNLFGDTGSKKIFLEVSYPKMIKRSPPVTFQVVE